MEQDFETLEEEQDLTAEPEDDAPVSEAPEEATEYGQDDEVLEEVAAQEPADGMPSEAAEAAASVPTSFGTVTGRLSEIAEVMEDETMPLDDALDLLEEAVALGMQASNLLESDMEAHNAEEDDEETEAEPGEIAE